MSEKVREAKTASKQRSKRASERKTRRLDLSQSRLAASLASLASSASSASSASAAEKTMKNSAKKKQTGNNNNEGKEEKEGQVTRSMAIKEESPRTSLFKKKNDTAATKVPSKTVEPATIPTTMEDNSLLTNPTTAGGTSNENEEVDSTKRMLTRLSLLTTPLATTVGAATRAMMPSNIASAKRKKDSIEDYDNDNNDNNDNNNDSDYQKKSAT